jgi:hypothetical protein
MGTWQVHHRRLKERLAGNDGWQEFEGPSTAWPILDGAGNIDDNVLELPAGTYRAISLRTFDPETDRWSIWWLMANPSRLIRPWSAASERYRHVPATTRSMAADPRPVRLVGHHRPRAVGAGLLPDGGETWRSTDHGIHQDRERAA